MTGIKTNEKHIKNLYSTNSSIVADTLAKIKESGNSSYIPVLIDLLHNTREEQTSSSILDILSEIKHADAVPFMVEAIENDKYSKIHEMLIRCCWENGLDYSNHLSVFVSHLISGSYMTAFEAYTVIENTETKISETSAKQMIDQLQNALNNNTPADRKTLIDAIIKHLQFIV
jgi:ribosomal protein S7